MLSFLSFITESLDVDKLRHLEHAEDHIIHGGHEGVVHALDNLHDVHKLLKGQKTKTRVTTKYDGCLSGDTLIFTDRYGIISLKELYQYWSINADICTFGYKDGQIVSTKILDKLARKTNKKWIAIIMENGHTIKLTEDHEVMLNDGRWIKAKELTPGDDILSYNFDK
jgi:hypothetical protein